VLLLMSPSRALDALTARTLQDEVMRTRTTLKLPDHDPTMSIEGGCVLFAASWMMTNGHRQPFGEILYIELDRQGTVLRLADDPATTSIARRVLVFCTKKQGKVEVAVSGLTRQPYAFARGQ